jgi:hypothetical protein
MEVERHPTFLRKWGMGFVAIAGLLVGGGGALIAWGDLLPEMAKGVLLWGLLGAVLMLMLVMALMPYRIRCPRCGEATETRRDAPELPERFSVLCRRCQTLWDLGLGIGE